MKTERRVLVIGNLSWEQLLVVEQLPRPNEDVFLEERYRFPGGAAANVAATLAMLGDRVSLLAKVGTDERGDQLVRDLAAYGVEIDLVSQSTASTAEFLVVMDRAGQRSFFLDPNQASFRLDAADLQQVAWSSYDAVCIAGPNASLTENALAASRAAGLRVALNAGFLVAGGAAHDAVLRLAHEADLVFLNRSELDALSPAEQNALLSGPSRPRQGTIVTAGAESASWHADGNTECVAPSRGVRVVNSLGCGDAFMAGCVSALWRGESPRAALAQGHRCAASVAGLPVERDASASLFEVRETHPVEN